MSSPCNSLNVQTIKISSLASPSRAIQSNDYLLLIQNDSPNYYSRKTTIGDLVSYISDLDGSYTGSFTGSFIGRHTGSFTGSFVGDHTGDLVGTSSWATNAVTTETASYVEGYASGSGTTDYYAYWKNSAEVAGSDWLRRNTTGTVAGFGLSGAYPAATGRVTLYRPLAVNNYIGQQFIQFSASAAGINYMYDIGLQPGSSYIRTGANFAIYYSGSYDGNTSFVSASEKDGYWNPNTAAKKGIYGWTSFGVRGRLVGVGHFPQTNNVQAQLHVHLSSSFGWPQYYADNLSQTNTYIPHRNVFLVTSGSSYTKLMRVSGSGQLDVRGDIVAYSTFASSDARLKDDIEPIEDAIGKLSSLNPVSFVWNNTEQSDFGLIAQEVEDVFPEFVKEDMNGFKAVKYNSFVSLLIKTVQEQQSLIEDLQERVSALEDK
jgi:hypothetical protein